MSMKIRLARTGSKNHPSYKIIATDSRMPRDGRCIEKLGTYNPLMARTSAERIKINLERIKYWLSKGAQVTDRVSRMLESSGVIDKKNRNNQIKGRPSKKALDRAQKNG